MAQFSIIFNPATDNLADVQASVAHLFSLFGALGADGEDGEDATPAANAPTHDSTGMPWDARIHSASKALTDKGVWRKRKGASPTVVAQVEAELRGAAQAPAATPQMPSMPATPQMPSMPATPQMPSMPATPQMPSMPPAAPSAYEQLVRLLAENTHSPANPTGRLTEDWIKTQCLPYYQVPGGLVQNVAGWPDESINNIINGIKGMLQTA